MKKIRQSAQATEKIKVCLYLQPSRFNQGSGIGKAFEHQKAALGLSNVKYTENPDDQDYQILHVNSYFPGTLKIIRKAKKQGKKIVIHAHMTSEDFKGSIIFSGLLSHFIRMWLNYFYSKADLIICPSTYTKDLLSNYSKIKNKPIKAISNGIDIDYWAYSRKRGDKFKKDYNLKEPIVFAVGLVFPRKGVVDFIKVSRKMPLVWFVWVGRYLNNMVKNMKLIHELKKKPDNFLLAGFVDDIIGAYSAGDIFFFPSYEENEGIVVLEAAAMKKAIIVRDIPVFRSFLKPGVDCLMAKTNEGFAEKIDLLLKNEKLRKKISENARKLAEKKSLENVGKELKGVYVQLISS